MSVDSGGDGYAVSCREGSDELAAFANNLCESGIKYWMDILAHASMPEVAGVLYNPPGFTTDDTLALALASCHHMNSAHMHAKFQSME